MVLQKNQTILNNPPKGPGKNLLIMAKKAQQFVWNGFLLGPAREQLQIYSRGTLLAMEEVKDFPKGLPYQNSFEAA